MLVPAAADECGIKETSLRQTAFVQTALGPIAQGAPEPIANGQAEARFWPVEQGCGYMLVS